jgi:hypothetical protein
MILQALHFCVRVKIHINARCMSSVD